MALREPVIALVEEGDSHCAAATVNGRYNTDLRQRYQTMVQAGKPPKVALAALTRKMIELANALLKQDRKWTPKTA
jgi:transposase